MKVVEGGQEMIISRTPYRISLFGGGTDYPDWYLKHGGEVLAAAIDKYCYLTCRFFPPFFDYKYRVVWSEIELRRTLDEIRHPAVREVLRFLKIENGVEIHHQGDLPARSGLGSSSSFTVGLLHAMYALRGNMASKMQLAMESIYIEQDMIKERVGSQDQVSAAFGGLNHILFSPSGQVSVNPVTIPAERMSLLNDHLMLFYTGIKRTAAQVASTYVDNIDENKRALRITKDLVGEVLTILNSSQDLSALGELLHEAWQVKRTLSDAVSNGEIDSLYETAREAGAIGGKITGAGGGGFMLLFVPPERRERVREALGHFIHVPINLDFGGSQIIFYDPEIDYSAEADDRSCRVIQAFREMSECEYKMCS